ncbi:MAG TPA: flagellar biosynthesis anti-sigma factor FlgM [Firmicutes bacterium]|nr:flagellar biosynthesis anti-sigma factor FlgM [Bacillota bacterium]
MQMNNINRLRALRNEQAAGAEERKKAVVRHDAATKDQVSISAQAQDALRLRAAISEAPDIRTDKVNALRAAIAQGTYRVPAEAIAEKMLRHTGDQR